MPRLPYGAVTLIAQATDHKKSAKSEPVGEVDGYGVFRTIKFDKATSKWLAPLIRDDDPRIEDSSLTDAGYLHVTFVPGPWADHKQPFNLDEADDPSGE
jgi:hypothetical protein